MTRAFRAGKWAYDQPYVLLTATLMFWTGNIIVGRMFADAISPITFTFARWTIAWIVVLPFVWKDVREDLPAVRAHAPILVVLSAVGLAINNVLAYEGLKSTEAINALVFQPVGPLAIAFWSFALFRDRLTPLQAIGMTAAVVGILVVVLKGDFGRLASLHLSMGDLWYLAALSLYGLYAALLRKRPPLHATTFVVVTFFIATVMLTPFLLSDLSKAFPRGLTLSVVGACFYIAIFPSLIAYFFFTRAVDLVGAVRAGAFMYLMPVFGTLIAMLTLGEQPHLFHAAGFALILGGVVLVSRQPAAKASVAAATPPRRGR